MSSSAGKVLILPKGEYNNATQYQMLDAVRYNRSLYIAKKTTIGNVPADGEYWMLCAVGATDIHWGDITGSIANQSDLINALDAKQNVLTFDSTPTASSNNPVTSAGIKTALDTKQNTLTFDTTPTSGSTNPVTSEGIFTAVQATASNLATIESSTTASQAYSEGDHLVLNGQLYEVIADIASGETLVVGTNISATNVGDELTALNNGLMYESTTITDNHGTVYNCKKYNNGDIEICDVVDIVFHGSSEGPYNGMYRSRETRSFPTMTRIDFAFAQGTNSNVFISSTQPTSDNNTILYVAQSINAIATGLTISSTSVLIRGRWK